MGQVNWTLVDNFSPGLRGIGQQYAFVGNIMNTVGANARNLALSNLFVDMSQERAMRSAGTLMSSMLELEGAYLRAHMAAMQWGETTVDAAAHSMAFTATLPMLDELNQKSGKLFATWAEAAAQGGFLSGKTLTARANLDIFAALHPGLAEATQAAEQLLMARQGLSTAQLHLAISQMMLRENMRIAFTAERLLEIQTVASAVQIGAAFGGPWGAAAGLGVGLGMAFEENAGFQSFNDNMEKMATNSQALSEHLLTNSGNLTEMNSNLDNLNINLKTLIIQMRSVGGGSSSFGGFFG